MYKKALVEQFGHRYEQKYYIVLESYNHLLKLLVKIIQEGENLSQYEDEINKHVNL